MSSLSESAILRWGICSAGAISNDFSAAIASLPQHHKITFVGARSSDRAAEFAKKFEVAKSGSYDELAQATDVDIVYIGAVNSQHLHLGKLMLECGKHVLCEKPLTVNARQSQELIDLARQKGLFLQEGIWTRMFPLTKRVGELLESKAIGDVKLVNGTFCINGMEITRRKNFFTIAGEAGALLDLGIYLLQWVLFVFKEYPTDITCRGIKAPDGADLAMSITLQFSRDRIASILCSCFAVSKNSFEICGTKGYIKIPSTMWSPISLDVNGQLETCPVPENTSGQPLVYGNSEGFQYEVESVRRCLIDGKKENAEVSHETSLQLARIMDECRAQMGIVYPSEQP